MTSSRRILIGLAGGIVTGLFFGEHAAALKWAADGFVRLLQMMVLPYITVSIVASLGSLDYAQIRTLGLRGAAVIGLLWAVGLAFALLIPLTFPATLSASFFSTSLAERRPPFDLVNLYIPSNPFYALANSVVPAVVLFSIVLGVALVGVPGKARLLEVLYVGRDAITRATRLVARLTPYGLFAIAANAAGTLSVTQLSRLQVYLAAYVAVGLLVALWVLPALVATLTPIRARDMLREPQEALVTAFIAGDLFIVLPGLIQASRTLLDGLDRLDASDRETGQLTDVIVPVSFNFPHTGKLLSLSFVLFAGWFADAVVPWSRYPELAVSGLLSFFGSLSAAVPFLLDQFGIPVDTFQLFLATSVVNARVGSLVAAVHTMAVTILVACAVTGRMRLRRGAAVRYAITTAVLALVVVGGTRVLSASTLSEAYSKDKVLASMQLLEQPVAATVAREPSPPPPTTLPPLETIDAQRVLRIGYMPNALPFAFFNAKGDLVGFDVDLAHRLARDMRVSLAFVPVEPARMAELLDAGYCDLIMSGVPVTADRARVMRFSDSYLDETLAFVMPDGQRERFATWDAVRSRARLTIGVPNVPYYVDMLRTMAPNATVEIQPVDAFFAGAVLTKAGIRADALALPAERGSAWTLIYPAYSVIVPGPNPVRVPLAYPIGKRDAALASFVNNWITLKRKDGTLDAVYKYWILGQNAAPPESRWSIVKDVLHWMD